MKTRLMLAASAAAVMAVGPGAGAQTATSLFRLTDSLQVSEIASSRAVQYYSTGHHGPAIENSACALRIYFNDSGAIDVYSKSGARMELLEYLWYPDSRQQEEEGAGRDEYLVGRTLGLGGIALWDGNEVVRLKATKTLRLQCTTVCAMRRAMKKSLTVTTASRKKYMPLLL